MGGICRTGRAAEAGIRNSADTVVDGSSGRNEGIENSDAPCSLFAIGKVSTSLSGGDLFKVFKEGGRGRGMGMGIMVSGLELSLLLPPSWRSCIPIEGGLIGLGVLGWSQSELGLEFEFDLEGELPIPLFLCVRACCFMLPVYFISLETPCNILGWLTSQSELGLELDLEGELLTFWFLCVAACWFMLPFVENPLSHTVHLKGLSFV